MKRSTIYDIATGEIKKTVIVPFHHVIRLEKGEAILDGHYDDDKFMVVAGAPVERLMASVPESYNEPQPTTEAGVRRLRNSLLNQSDWTQVADAPIDQAAWAIYRQALRDIPNQEGFPVNVNWPQPL